METVLLVCISLNISGKWNVVALAHCDQTVVARIESFFFVRAIRKHYMFVFVSSLYVSTLLNEVVRSHHAESSGNFVRLLWHPLELEVTNEIAFNVLTEVCQLM